MEPLTIQITNGGTIVNIDFFLPECEKFWFTRMLPAAHLICSRNIRHLILTAGNKPPTTDSIEPRSIV